MFPCPTLLPCSAADVPTCSDCQHADPRRILRLTAAVSFGPKVTGNCTRRATGECFSPWVLGCEKCPLHIPRVMGNIGAYLVISQSERPLSGVVLGHCTSSRLRPKLFCHSGRPDMMYRVRGKGYPGFGCAKYTRLTIWGRDTSSFPCHHDHAWRYAVPRPRKQGEARADTSAAGMFPCGMMTGFRAACVCNDTC